MFICGQLKRDIRQMLLEWSIIRVAHYSQWNDWLRKKAEKKSGALSKEAHGLCQRTFFSDI